MKKLIIFSLLGLSIFQFAFALSIKDAQKEGLISVFIGEQENSTHYHAPFKMQITNLSNRSLDLELDNGMTLIPSEPSEQNFIVTKQVLLALAAKQKKSVNVFAMCIEQSDSAPDSESSYSIGDYANESLRALSSFVEENESFEPDAQFLMWSIAEGDFEKDEIDGFEIDEDGQVWVIDEQGQILEVKNPVWDEEEVAKPKLMVNGSFEMSFSRPKNVHIAMFNSSNVIVKELFKNPSTPVGTTNLDYAFNSYDYSDEEYFVKLVVNGEVIMTRTIDMRF